MALNRWVKPLRPWSSAARIVGVGGVGVAGGDDHAGRRPAARSVSRLVASGARVTRVRPTPSEVSRANDAVVGAAQLAGVVDALARDVEERALDVDAEHAGRRRPRSPRGSPRSPRSTVAEVVADQGRQEAGGAEAAVRGADARRWPPAVGASLNSTPPPPLTWVSMKPGQQQRAAEVARVGAGGDLARADRPRRCARRRRRTARPSTQAAVGHHPAVDEREVHQRVSVILVEVRRPVRVEAARQRQRVDQAVEAQRIGDRLQHRTGARGRQR